MSELGADVAYAEQNLHHCVRRSLTTPEVLGAQSARDLVTRASQALTGAREALGPVTQPALVQHLIDSDRVRRGLTSRTLARVVGAQPHPFARGRRSGTGSAKRQ